MPDQVGEPGRQLEELLTDSQVHSVGSLVDVIVGQAAIDGIVRPNRSASAPLSRTSSGSSVSLINGTVRVASLRADLLNTRGHNTRLQQHIRALENRLSDSLGEAVFRDSGLGAPDDIRSLQQALTGLEQQLLELAPPARSTQ
ncbi:hypothetical protein ACGFIF_38090 [Kribbella sp. NPDC049174]|uniref:hypothetical protein n=1 Tax=Kribbella sp. NPDC049174 TaxID=3364112 RepID=UPI0037197D67